MAANTIFLDACERHDERLASGIFSPGHLLDIDSDGKVLKHATEGGRALWLAKEDSLQGRTINDAYAVGELARLGIPYRGTKVRARVAAGAVAIVKGDELISDGAGGVKKRLIPSGVMFAATAAATRIDAQATTADAAFDVSYTIPANSLRVGDVLHIRGSVLFATASNSTETCTIKLKIGSNTILTTVALDHAANDVATFHAIIHVRAIGSSGSIVAFGLKSAGVPTTVAAPQTQGFYLGATTVNTTTTNVVTVTLSASGNHANTGGQLTDLVIANERRDVDLFVADEAVDNSAGVAETFVKAIALGA